MQYNNSEIMNGYKIVFLILAVIFISMYTYNYYTLDESKTEIKTLTTPNNCISANEINSFGSVETKDFTINIPNTWKVKTFEGAQTNNSLIFGINEYDNTEFLSVWIGDYNKTAHDFLIDTLKPLSNYTITEEKEVSSNIGIIRNIKINFKSNNEYVQDMYVIIKNNKAYLILIRAQSINYLKYSETINKVICSFNNKN